MSTTRKPSKTSKSTAEHDNRKSKAAAGEATEKAQKAGRKGAATVNAKAKSVAKKTAVKAKTPEKPHVGFVQTVKDGIHAGMEAVGELVKKITPDALLPDSAKSKQRV